MTAIAELLRIQHVQTTYVYRISNPTMEEISATNPKYQPLRVLWHPFVHLRSKNHPFGAHSPIYWTNSTFSV